MEHFTQTGECHLSSMMLERSVHRRAAALSGWVDYAQQLAQPTESLC
jgi:hypothetical protein